MFSIVSIGLLCDDFLLDLLIKRVKKVHVCLTVCAVVNNIVQKNCYY